MTSESNEYTRYIENYKKNLSHPFKIILQLYKGKGKQVIPSIFFALFQQMPVWVIPIVISNIINIATDMPEDGMKKIIINLIVAVACISQNIFSTYTRVKFYAKANRNIENSLRKSIIIKLQYLSIMFYKEMQSGTFQSKIMRDVESVSDMLNNIFLQLLFFVTNLIVIVTVVLTRDPFILLFFVVIIPLTTFMVAVFRKRITKENKNYRCEMEKTQGAVSEMIEMIPIVRAHGLQENEINKMDTYIGNIQSVGYKLDLTNALFGSSTWVTFQLFQIIALAFTGILAFKGKLMIGDVVLYQTYFTQLVNQFSALIGIYPQLTKGVESIKSIGEILSDEDIETDNAIIPLDKFTGSVEFKNVSFRYNDSEKNILDNFSLKIKPGESIAFVGASGAGKTTILNLLIGYINPTDGRILIDGINKTNLDMKQYRSHIAVVPQNTILFSGTIKENITYGLSDFTDEEINDVIREVGLDDMIKSLPDGIDTNLGQHGDRISGGQKQRISIARALIRHPDLILFDEATSALDSISEQKVKDAVNNMMHKCTTITVAHRLSTIINTDRIIVLKDGKIAEIGNFNNLMSNKGIFYNMYNVQDSE